MSDALWAARLGDDLLHTTLLADIVGVDFPARSRRFEVVYLLRSISRNQRIALTVAVGEGEAVPSATSLYKSADWHEREVYDLVGVRFTGHGDLRRILCPEDWQGHPLRKDYEQPDDYHGIPTR